MTIVQYIIYGIISVLSFACIIALKLSLPYKNKIKKILDTRRESFNPTRQEYFQFLLARFTLLEMLIIRHSKFKLFELCAFGIFSLLAVLIQNFYYWGWILGTIICVGGFIGLEIYRLKLETEMKQQQENQIKWVKLVIYSSYALIAILALSGTAYYFSYFNVYIPKYLLNLFVSIIIDQLISRPLLLAGISYFSNQSKLFTNLYFHYKQQEKEESEYIEQHQGFFPASPTKKTLQRMSPSKIPKAISNNDIDSHFMNQSKPQIILNQTFQHDMDSLVNFLELSHKKKIEKVVDKGTRAIYPIDLNKFVISTPKKSQNREQVVAQKSNQKQNNNKLTQSKNKNKKDTPIKELQIVESIPDFVHKQDDEQINQQEGESNQEQYQQICNQQINETNENNEQQLSQENQEHIYYEQNENSYQNSNIQPKKEKFIVDSIISNSIINNQIENNLNSDIQLQLQPQEQIQPKFISQIQTIQYQTKQSRKINLFNNINNNENSPKDIYASRQRDLNHKQIQQTQNEQKQSEIQNNTQQNHNNMLFHQTKRDFNQIQQEYEEDLNLKTKNTHNRQQDHSNDEYPQNQNTSYSRKAETLNNTKHYKKSFQQDFNYSDLPKNSFLEIKRNNEPAQILQLQQVDLNSPIKKNKLKQQVQESNKSKPLYHIQQKYKKKPLHKRNLKQLRKLNSGSPYLEYLPNMLSKQIKQFQLNKRSHQVIKDNKEDKFKRGKSTTRRATHLQNQYKNQEEENHQNICPELYLEDF